MTTENKIDRFVKSSRSREARSRCLKQRNPCALSFLKRMDSRLRTSGMTALGRRTSYKSVQCRGLYLSGGAGGGFTLLEIMISLAIIGGLLVTVIYTLNYHLSLAERQEFQTTATMLSKNKIVEAEKNPVDSKGEFPEPYSGYRYETTINESPYLGVSVLTVAVSRGNEEVKLSEMIEIRLK